MRNAPGGNGLFLNNCRIGHDPMETARAPHVYRDGKSEWIDLAKYPGQDWNDISFTVVSYEDVVPPAQMSLLFGVPEMAIVIHRSFRNWLASLLRKLQNNPVHGGIDRFKIMTHAMALYRDMHARMAERDITPVHYDDWVASAAYRTALLERLGLPARDLDLGQVQPFGGGSSFEAGLGQATAEGKSDRHLSMADDWEYKTLLDIAARDAALRPHLTDHAHDHFA